MSFSIVEQDPDGRLVWEIDYPESHEDWTPFLASQVRIDADGKLHSKFYRKSQKKHITLHMRSHHPLRTSNRPEAGFLTGTGSDRK